MYSETLRPTPSWWILIALFAASVGWVFLVVSSWTVGIVAGVLTLLACGAALWRLGSLRIEVGPDLLVVAEARLQGSAIGAATALDAETLRRLRGPEADARAFTRIRSYVDTGVRIEVDDPHDPTPYWLVSSRNPDLLVASLTATDKDRDEPIADHPIPGEQQSVEEEQ